MAYTLTGVRGNDDDALIPFYLAKFGQGHFVVLELHETYVEGFTTI